MDNCDFCDQATLEKQVIYKSDKILVFYPRSPVIREHLMVIPERHVEDFQGLREEEVLESTMIVKRIFKAFENQGASGFNLFTNVGKKAGQHVPHFHWHVFIRFDNEKVSPYKILSDPKLKESISPEEWKKRRDMISKFLKTDRGKY